MKLQAVVFDYGGTLDGCASHWLDRFLALYRQAGLELTFERFRPAFDHATQCGYRDPRVATYDLRALVEFHVAHHFEYLGERDAQLAAAVTAAFMAASRAAWAESRSLLEKLRPRVALGVISNFYGNLDRVLDEAGLAALLTAVIDSSRAGVSKPDPEIFSLAVRLLGCPAGEVLYVGDSFEKDMVGAHDAGLRTAWLVGPTERPCRAPELMDVQLRSLAEIETLIA